MCDLYSWGVMKEDFRSFKKGDILFLTDAEVSIVSEKHHRALRDYIGHSGISKYYKVPENLFEHCESNVTVPDIIAKEINAGHLAKLTQAAIRDNDETPPEATSWKFIYDSVPGFKLRGLSYEEAPSNLPLDHPHWKRFFSELKKATKSLHLDYPTDADKYTQAAKIVRAVIHRGMNEFCGATVYAPINRAVDTYVDWSKHDGYEDAFADLYDRTRI